MLYTLTTLLATLAAASPLTAPGTPEDDAGPLSSAELVRLRERILPLPAETEWERIPWRPAFGAGLLEAERARLPVLLWVMNGHPLGCT